MSQDNGHSAEAFRDRVAALLAESHDHVTKLTDRRQALVTEREAEIARIREDYRSKLEAIEAELAQVRRLERALDPDAPKAGPKTNGNANGNGKAKDKGRKPPAFTPSADAQRAVLAGLMAEDKSTIPELAERVGLSHTTVKYALDIMRDDRPQLVRLAGQGPRNAHLWAITNEGNAALSATEVEAA